MVDKDFAFAFCLGSLGGKSTRVRVDEMIGTSSGEILDFIPGVAPAKGHHHVQAFAAGCL